MTDVHSYIIEYEVSMPPQVGESQLIELLERISQQTQKKTTVKVCALQCTYSLGRLIIIDTFFAV